MYNKNIQKKKNLTKLITHFNNVYKTRKNQKQIVKRAIDERKKKMGTLFSLSTRVCSLTKYRWEFMRVKSTLCYPRNSLLTRYIQV